MSDGHRRTTVAVPVAAPVAAPVALPAAVPVAGTPDRHADGDAVIEAKVARVRADPELRDELVPLLDERCPLFDGRGSAAVTRARAWVMSTFAQVGLPEAALPYVLDDLRNELDADAVAGAAMAARGLVGGDPAIVDALLAALHSIRGRDRAVSFAALRPRWSAGAGSSGGGSSGGGSSGGGSATGGSSALPRTTALLEVLAALRWQPRVTAAQFDRLVRTERDFAADWSGEVRAALTETITQLRPRRGRQLLLTDVPAAPTTPLLRAPQTLDGVVVQDQSAAQFPLVDFLTGAVTVVAFFYTRCQNPNKCSLTITKLAELQRCRAPAAPKIQLAAISYDPGYDLPGRLTSYGEARGLVFGPSVRMLRAVERHDQLRSFFGLLVGYNGTLVNRHSVEVYLVDPGVRVLRSWTRLPWDVTEVAAAVRAVAGGQRESLGTVEEPGTTRRPR